MNLSRSMSGIPDSCVIACHTHTRISDSDPHARAFNCHRLGLSASRLLPSTLPHPLNPRQHAALSRDQPAHTRLRRLTHLEDLPCAPILVLRPRSDQVSDYWGMAPLAYGLGTRREHGCQTLGRM
eukprot:3918315-Rhodomonas_salina.1